MPVTAAMVVFAVAAAVSLTSSWVLVRRLERVGERLGLSEALLGRGCSVPRRTARASPARGTALLARP